MNRPGLVILCSAVALLAGCGGQDVEDPARAVPEDAFVYAEAVIDPDGSSERAVRSVLATLPDGERAPELVEQVIDRAARENGDDLRYARDIEPWLGDRVGGFVLAPPSFEDDTDPDGAFVAVSEDDDAARELVDRLADADEQRETERSHEGFDYLLDEEGQAAGVGDGLLIAGSEAGLKAAVDALGSDQSLAEQEDFRETFAGAPDERIGSCT